MNVVEAPRQVTFVAFKEWLNCPRSYFRRLQREAAKASAQEASGHNAFEPGLGCRSSERQWWYFGSRRWRHSRWEYRTASRS